MSVVHKNEQAYKQNQIVAKNSIIKSLMNIFLTSLCIIVISTRNMVLFAPKVKNDEEWKGRKLPISLLNSDFDQGS